MGDQLTIFDAIFDLLKLDVRFIPGGILLLGVTFYQLHKRKLLTFGAGIALAAFYYYLATMLSHVVGIPTIKEWLRLSGLGEHIFNPDINLIPLADGLSWEFIMNVIFFAPLGFLCPMISKSYEKAKNVLLIGFCFSLAIELSQLFVLYRITDISDLIANTLGAFAGYLCFQFIRKATKGNFANQDRAAGSLPVVYLVFAFIITFLQI